MTSVQDAAQLERLQYELTVAHAEIDKLEFQNKHLRLQVLAQKQLADGYAQLARANGSIRDAAVKAMGEQS